MSPPVLSTKRTQLCSRHKFLHFSIILIATVLLLYACPPQSHTDTHTHTYYTIRERGEKMLCDKTDEWLDGEMFSNKHKFRVRRDWDLLTALPVGVSRCFPNVLAKTRNVQMPRRISQKAKVNTERQAGIVAGARVMGKCSFLLPDCVITHWNDKDGWSNVIRHHANRFKHPIYHYLTHFLPYTLEQNWSKWTPSAIAISGIKLGGNPCQRSFNPYSVQLSFKYLFSYFL